MHTDARKISNHSLIEGDICIIGAGAAGISIALEFINTSRKIILLESGGLEYDPESQLLNKGYNIGQNYWPLSSARLRYFGGTTGHWAGFCSTLDPIDFEERKWVPHSGWPFTRKDMDRYYERAHPVCDLGTYTYDLAYWEKQNPAFQHLRFDESRVRTKMWQKSPPTRFGIKYRKAILDAPKVHLYTFANVTNIDLNKSGSSVTGLELKTLDGKQHRVRAKQYVLSCGAIDNAQVLLCSNSVMKNGVGNQNDLVGRYFMEHPHVDSADMVLAGNPPMYLYYESFLAIKQFGMLALSEEYQRRHNLLNYSAQLIFDPVVAERDHFIDSVPADSKKILEFWKGIEKAKKEDGGKDKKENAKNYVFSTRIEQTPNPDSRVELAATKDALGMQEVNLNWQLSELDKRTIKEANLMIGRELGRTGLGRLRLRDWLFTDNPIWPHYLEGGWHHMGTTRMNNDPKKGVVDANCKVHGLPNLYIAGSSVFPTGGTANPTLTIVALSLRLADHLKSLD
jgi:choline dehydrogenase-like flavoprotein